MVSKDTNLLYRQEIIALLESFKLTDVWRIHNPYIRRYTWNSRGKSSLSDDVYPKGTPLNHTDKCSLLTVPFRSRYCHSRIDQKLNK